MKATTFDQHFEETLHRVRTEFERTGELHPTFECLTDRERFHVPAGWPDGGKAAACIALKDCFRRRGVKRYVFTSEAWASKTPGLAPADDPDPDECGLVLAVERNGPRRYASAEITRNGATATLGPWQIDSEVPPSWLAELLEDGYSDRSRKSEPPALGELSKADFQDLRYRDPKTAAGCEDSFEIHSELSDLIDFELQKHPDVGSIDMLMALESVLLGIVKDMGSPTGFISEFARFIRDYPDQFSMFSAGSEQVPSMQHVRVCKTPLAQFNCEKREAGHSPSAIFGAFMNTYMDLGSQAIGALDLADRIEAWDPEHQAKLREAGLRSSFELDDDEGSVFIAITADRYPIGLMGRRNTDGDLFVSKLVNCPQADFATAVQEIKEMGMGLVLGSDAEELLGKMEQVTGTVLRADKKEEIWEFEDWGPDEWFEQAAAEMAFAMAMNVQYDPERSKLDGNVAGYRVRRAPRGLVLIPSDPDEEIFVAVKLVKSKKQAQILGWLRGSEGKVPQFYQQNCWIIPAEALHHIEKLPGK
ncbi:MAG: hypothetical protein WBZ51_04275 [Xanthobacteraceae bacterium]